MRQKVEATKKFWWYGSFFGIMIPMGIFVVYNIINPNDFNGIYNYILIFSILLLFLAFAPYPLADKYLDSKWSEKKVDYLLYVTGALSIIFVAILVYLTGGMKNSLFAFFFFFIPSAIAASFKGAKRSLQIVCLMSFIAVAINMFIHNPLNNTVYNTIRYNIVYVVFIAIHLLLIYILEAKENDILECKHCGERCHEVKCPNCNNFCKG